jgi:phosphatidylglycerol:prolipoprotein diacylglycerol transferase
MLPVIQIGPAAIQTSLLALVAAIWLGGMVAEREAKKRTLNGDVVWNLISIGAIVTLIAARLVYVVQNFSAYAGDPLQIFSPAPGTLALGYGAIFGALAAYAYTQRKKTLAPHASAGVPHARLLDAMALGALVAIAIFSFGQFLSGDAYGTPTNLPWAIFLWGEPRHPVQLYDALGTFIGWVVLTRVRDVRDGRIALYAVIWYGATRLVVDAYRGEAMLLPNGVRVSQVVALGALLIALWMLAKNKEQIANGL